MSDIDERGLKPLVELDDLGAHLHAEFCIEVGKRLIQKEKFRLAHDGSAERDALTLSARKCFWLAVEIFRDAEDLRRFLDTAVYLVLRELLYAQGERHILIHGHMRIKRVVLEDHGNVSVLRLDIVHEHTVDVESAGRDLLKPRDHSERGGLAASGRSYENDELLVVYRQVEVVDGFDAALIDLAYVFQFRIRHRTPLIVSPHPRSYR